VSGEAVAGQGGEVASAMPAPVTRPRGAAERVQRFGGTFGQRRFVWQQILAPALSSIWFQVLAHGSQGRRTQSQLMPRRREVNVGFDRAEATVSASIATSTTVRAAGRGRARGCGAATRRRHHLGLR
jgi:hypothetical protein